MKKLLRILTALSWIGSGVAFAQTDYQNFNSDGTPRISSIRNEGAEGVSIDAVNGFIRLNGALGVHSVVPSDKQYQWDMGGASAYLFNNDGEPNLDLNQGAILNLANIEQTGNMSVSVGGDMGVTAGGEYAVSAPSGGVSFSYGGLFDFNTNVNVDASGNFNWGGNTTSTISANGALTVGGKYDLNVTGNLGITSGGDASVSVAGSIGVTTGTLSASVTGPIDLNSGGNIRVNSETGIQVTVNDDVGIFADEANVGIFTNNGELSIYANHFGMGLDGILATLSFDMSGNYIKALHDPVDPQDAATKAYVDSAEFDTGSLWEEADGNIEMTSPATIIMNDKPIKELAAGVTLTDAVNLGQMQTAIADAVLSGVVTMTGGSVVVTDGAITTSSVLVPSPDSIGTNIGWLAVAYGSGSATITSTNILEAGPIRYILKP